MSGEMVLGRVGVVRALVVGCVWEGVTEIGVKGLGRK